MNLKHYKSTVLQFKKFKKYTATTNWGCFCLPVKIKYFAEHGGRDGKVELVCMLRHFSHVQLFVTPWSVAHQAPLCSWDSPGKKTGVGCQALPPGDLLDPGTELTKVSCIAGRFFIC